MNTKNTLYLWNKYPDLFAGRHEPITKSLIPFGFECEDGWFDLINSLCEKIVAINPDVRASQVKEKFGTLRFYLNFYDEEVDKLIEEAETRSSYTCEVCGQLGQLCHRGSWLKTLCEDCRVQLEYQLNEEEDNKVAF
jgi:hypothetical protein